MKETKSFTDEVMRDMGKRIQIVRMQIPAHLTMHSAMN